jgi:hypothetical protein
MRFRHLDAAPVLEYLRTATADITLLEWERERRPGGLAALVQLARPLPADPARPATIEEIDYIAGHGRGPSHAGLVLRYYFHINRTETGRPLTLVEAVEHVESRGVYGEFLLAGHPDGGLISVSNAELPFQRNLAPITWWGP